MLSLGRPLENSVRQLSLYHIPCRRPSLQSGMEKNRCPMMKRTHATKVS